MPEAQQTDVPTPIIAFGTKEAQAGPIPFGLKMFYRVLMIASTVWVCFVEPVFLNIPPAVAHHIDQALFAANLTIYQVAQQFGWVLPKNDQLPKNE